jgi:hypothetical protein
MDVFILYTKPSNPNDWRLLICDGHGLHATLEFRYICFKNNITVMVCNHVLPGTCVSRLFWGTLVSRLFWGILVARLFLGDSGEPDSAGKGLCQAEPD